MMGSYVCGYFEKDDGTAAYRGVSMWSCNGWSKSDRFKQMMLAIYRDGGEFRTGLHAPFSHYMSDISKEVDDDVINIRVDGKVPLLFACRVATSDAVETLLNAEADVWMRNADGSTCLIQAARHQYEDGSIHNANKVISSAQYSKKQCIPMLNAHDRQGNTALMWAANTGKLKLVKYLLSKQGINVNLTNNNFESALSLAVSHSLDMVQALLNAGASITGYTAAIALSRAATGPRAVAEALLGARGDWGRREGDEAVLCRLAAVPGGERVLGMLLERVRECSGDACPLRGADATSGTDASAENDGVAEGVDRTARTEPTAVSTSVVTVPGHKRKRGDDGGAGEEAGRKRKRGGGSEGKYDVER
jgi:hypothetical protein